MSDEVVVLTEEEQELLSESLTRVQMFQNMAGEASRAMQREAEYLAKLHGIDSKEYTLNQEATCFVKRSQEKPDGRQQQ